MTANVHRRYKRQIRYSDFPKLRLVCIFPDILDDWAEIDRIEQLHERQRQLRQQRLYRPPFLKRHHRVVGRLEYRDPVTGLYSGRVSDENDEVDWERLERPRRFDAPIRWR